MSETFRDLPVITTLNTESGREVVICKGYDMRVVDDLVEKSKEQEIRKRCHRDSGRRFVSRGSFGAWATKGGGRTLYPALNAKTGELDQVVWLGVERFGITNYRGLTYNDPGRLALVASMTDTYAIRRYKSGERGLAKRHTRAAISDYVQGRLNER